MKNAKPMILITNDFTPAEASTGSTRLINCPSAYPRAVAAAGGVPVLTLEYCPEEMAERFDGLLLSGGTDVPPTLYSQSIRFDTVECDETRDSFEIPLARAFLAAKKPIFGICRGSQLLNALMGGDLWQDLPAELGFIHSNRSLRHFVITEEGSILRQLFGERFRVNSTHHQAVRRLAEGLRPTAFSLEGIVEAYEHESLPIFACQFHPERSVLSDDRCTPDFLPLFQHFVAMCGSDAADLF